MSTRGGLIDDNYREYTRLLRDLHALFVEGKGESEEADVLRDRMDHAWEILTPEQVKLVSGLAADLNWLLFGATSSAQTEATALEEYSLELQRANSREDWSSVLKCVRKLSTYLTNKDLAYWRGKAWQGLGDLDSARLFQNEAAKLEPVNGVTGSQAGRLPRAD